MQNCFVRLLSGAWSLLWFHLLLWKETPHVPFPLCPLCPAAQGGWMLFLCQLGCILGLGGDVFGLLSWSSFPTQCCAPPGAGKVFMTPPCPGLGTVGTVSLNIPHIQGLGWARSREGTQPGQLTPTDQRGIPDPQLRSKSYGREEERGALVICICLPEQLLRALAC